MFHRGVAQTFKVDSQMKLAVLLCLLISSCSSVPQKTITTYHGNLFPSLATSAVGSAPKLLLPESDSSDERRILTGSDFFYSTLDDGAGSHDACSFDKYAFDHDGMVKYANKLPALSQFTLCMWMRFTNHTGDHTIITYSVDDEPREMQLWISNNGGMSYISLAVHGQSLFRLNYPFKMRKWHHACASWNGKTGEWQLWIKSERVGRGFHNRLVGYEIRPHGTLFSGGPSITGPTDIGLHFELTAVQIYKVALSAGKAHRDHKHHHVHHFDINGGEVTSTTPRAPVTTSPQSANPLLANGQIPTRVKINLANGQQNSGSLGIPAKGLPSQLVGGFNPSTGTVTTNFVNGQFSTGGRLLQEQLVSGNLINQFPNGAPLSLPASSVNSASTKFSFPDSTSFTDISGTDGAYSIVQLPTDATARKLFKRQTKDTTADGTIAKRDIVQLRDGSLLQSSDYIFDGLAEFGLPDFKNKVGRETDIEDEIREHDKEPAEEEVKAVLHICTKCTPEPFAKALVFAWKDASIEPNGALQAKASSHCGHF
uniref:Putative concanavalin a-like lectin/glucanases superfamily protein n=1 Tax=Anopheles braziliensis TaxID=58242 RepID=A0A2M3Z1E8_9DIPT